MIGAAAPGLEERARSCHQYHFRQCLVNEINKINLLCKHHQRLVFSHRIADIHLDFGNVSISR